jgi:hypothetical protein
MLRGQGVWGLDPALKAVFGTTGISVYPTVYPQRSGRHVGRSFLDAKER